MFLLLLLNLLLNFLLFHVGLLLELAYLSLEQGQFSSFLLLDLSVSQCCVVFSSGAEFSCLAPIDKALDRT